MSSPTCMGWRAYCDGQDATVTFDPDEIRTMNRLDVYPVGITLKGIYEVAMGELAPYMDDGSISDTPTEPVESKTSESDTDTPADSAFDSMSDPETEKPKGGCGSAMLSCAAILGVAAGAVALKKNKEC